MPRGGEGNASDTEGTRTVERHQASGNFDCFGEGKKKETKKMSVKKGVLHTQKRGF